MEHKSDTQFDDASVALLHLLARDSMDNLRRSPLQERRRRLQFSSEESPWPGYKKILESHFWVLADFGSQIRDKLRDARELFEGAEYETFWAFPTRKGQQVIQEKYPKIWEALVGLGVSGEATDRLAANLQSEG